MVNASGSSILAHHAIKRYFMNRNIIVQIFFILCFCYSCKSQGSGSDKQKGIDYKSDSLKIAIVSIYFNLSNGRRLNYQEAPGQFIYLESNANTDRYLARFTTREIMQQVDYTSYSDDRKDTIALGSSTINLGIKVDPLSIKVYRFLFNGKKQLVFIGKAQSASGSGMQITYFVLTELNEKGKVVQYYEFESRFGNINSLVDYNKDGVLDYFKIVNWKKTGEYLLTVNNVKNNIHVIDGHILLKYELNDKFVVLEDVLTK